MLSGRAKKIKESLERYKHLFADNNLIPKVNRNIILFPDFVSYATAEGKPLKDGVGFISIQEDSQNGIRNSYIYRFSSNEYTYIFDKKDERDSCQKSFFNFHYSKDDIHYPHVSFLHSEIRYISKEIDLEQFLQFIEDTFYIEKDRKMGLPWHNHFI